MQFTYTPSIDHPFIVPSRYYHPYRFRVSYTQPKIEILYEEREPTRPFEDQQRLLNAMFKEDRVSPLDPLNFPGEKARIQNQQSHFLLEHLAARHAISYQIRKSIDYQEAGIHGQLDEVRSWPFPGGITSRRATDLEKQLLDLSKERWAEEVSCWRDTGRILGDVFEHWTEYADHSRRTRLMTNDL